MKPHLRLILHFRLALLVKSARRQTPHSLFYGLDSFRSRVLSSCPSLNAQTRVCTGSQPLIATPTTLQSQRSRGILPKEEHTRSITPCACKLIFLAVHGISF